MDDRARLLLVLVSVVSLVLSICVHEFSHAWAAWSLGDDTAARQGRLTLNPLVHADPIGTLFFPALFTFLGAGAFGWGRPVPYVATNLTRRFSMRAGEAMVAFAGPLSNLILSVICSVLLSLLLGLGWIDQSSPFAPLLANMVMLNVVLFFFNLLPFPPLDGSKICAWIFGQRADPALDALSRAGPFGFIFIALVAGPLINHPVKLVSDMIFGLGFGLGALL